MQRLPAMLPFSLGAATFAFGNATDIVIASAETRLVTVPQEIRSLVVNSEERKV